MAIKELGFVVVETQQPENWRSFLENVVGAMPVESPGGGVLHYRVDERPFRFRN